MDENREKHLEKIAWLEEEIEKLPIKLRNAVCWAIENYSVLEEMGKRTNMTPEEIRCAMEDALAEENYATFISLYITKFVKEYKENEEI